MLDWLFSPSCPCDPPAKAWVEERLEWLSNEFDDHAFNGRRIVLPTPAFFPDRFNNTPDGVVQLFETVCGYMDVNPQDVDLRFSSNTNEIWLVNEGGHFIPHAAGTYQEGSHRFIITLDKAEFSDPISLVGTMAHELAHLRLLGENRISRNIFDNEILTDLTVVFFGLGIFLANEPRNWQSQSTKWPSTQLNKPEYMTPPMYGYALAHLAWFRGENKPNWMTHLNSNSRHDFKQGIRFLFKTEQSAFRPARLAHNWKFPQE